jgi:hypothetical protein
VARASSSFESRSALELLVLVLGVDRVAGPAEEVTQRLERAAGAGLDRRERRLSPALERVEQAAAGLAEVRGQDRDGQRNEYGERRPPSADHLPVVHR